MTTITRSYELETRKMKRRATFYRDGAEIDEDEAFENGILKDGVIMSVPTAMRDSLSSLQRAVAADADRRVRVTDAFGGEAGHRPGAIVTKDQAARDAKALAYADYDCDVQNGWRSKTSPDGPLIGDNGPRPEIERRLEAVNACDATRDHGRIMQHVYDAYDHELAQRWRCI